MVGMPGSGGFANAIYPLFFGKADASGDVKQGTFLDYSSAESGFVRVRKATGFANAGHGPGIFETGESYREKVAYSGPAEYVVTYEGGLLSLATNGVVNLDRFPLPAEAFYADGRRFGFAISSGNSDAYVDSFSIQWE